MASREIVSGMITSFSQLYGRKLGTETEDLYFETLKPFSDKQVTRAAFDCMETCKFVPKPADIISAIHSNPVTRPLPKAKDFLIDFKKKCAECGHIGLAIQEPIGADWQCRQCYTGYTSAEIAAKFNALFKIMDSKRRRL